MEEDLQAQNCAYSIPDLMEEIVQEAKVIQSSIRAAAQASRRAGSSQLLTPRERGKAPRTRTPSPATRAPWGYNSTPKGKPMPSPRNLPLGSTEPAALRTGSASRRSVTPLNELKQPKIPEIVEDIAASAFRITPLPSPSTLPATAKTVSRRPLAKSSSETRQGTSHLPAKGSVETRQQPERSTSTIDLERFTTMIQRMDDLEAEVNSLREENSSLRTSLSQLSTRHEEHVQTTRQSTTDARDAIMTLRTQVNFTLACIQQMGSSESRSYAQDGGSASSSRPQSRGEGSTPNPARRLDLSTDSATSTARRLPTAARLQLQQE